MDEVLKRIIEASRKFMSDTVLQFRENCTDEGEDYWQGRKDAARLNYAMIKDAIGDNKEAAAIISLVESSPNSRQFDFELANDLLADAVYNVAAALYELNDLGRLDARTKTNLYKFVERYDYLSRDGKFPQIKDHC